MITTWYLAKNGLWWPVLQLDSAHHRETLTPHPPIPPPALGLPSSLHTGDMDMEGFMQDTRLPLQLVRIIGLDLTVTITESESHSLLVCPFGSVQFRELCENQVVPSKLEDVFRRSIRALISQPQFKLPSIPETEESTGDATESTPVTTEGSAENTSVSLAPIIPPTLKRVHGVLSWDDYFMSVAFLSAMRSKDPSTQVGACIVNPDMRIVGIGYNGFPRGCSDDLLPWARTAEDPLDTKYPFVCHAEMNAILNKNSADVNKCKIYVALFPCNECAKMIIQSGISEVVYCSDKHHHTMSMTASRRLLDMARIPYRQFVPTRMAVNIDFSTVI